MMSRNASSTGGVAASTRAPVSSARFMLRLVAGVVLINLFVLGMVVLSLQRSHQQYVDRAELTARNLTRLLDQSIHDAFDKVDLGLQAAADEAERELAEGGIRAADFNQALLRQQTRLKDVESMRATDADGIVRYGAGVGPGTMPNNSDREYFLRARDNPVATMVIGRPILARISKKWVIPIARRLNRPDGAFAGIVYVNIALAQIEKAFAAIEIGPHGAVTLRDADLAMVVRYPEPGDFGSVVGTRSVSPEFLKEIEAGKDTGTFTTAAKVDGIRRTFSYRRLAGYSHLVGVGLATEDYLADWRVEAALMMALAGLLALISAGFSWLIYRAWRGQAAAATELAEAEKRVRLLNDELEHRVVERTAELAAANKELEEFSYSVSHDLRSPLRAVVGFGQILEDDYGSRLDEEGRRLIGVIRDNGRRMGRLIDGLLEFLHLGRQPLRVLPVDLEALAREAFAELAPGDRRIGFQIGVLPPARGDAGMLKRVLAELLSNAIRFTARNDHAQIEVGGSASEEENTYFVRDNGVGFDMRYAGKLFQVFERLHGDAQLEGTGIGLAMVKRIVHRHGGRVWAEGKIGEGATVCFTLPANRGEKK
jgi:signal transduction histidine kinase